MAASTGLSEVRILIFRIVLYLSFIYHIYYIIFHIILQSIFIGFSWFNKDFRSRLTWFNVAVLYKFERTFKNISK